MEKKENVKNKQVKPACNTQKNVRTWNAGDECVEAEQGGGQGLKRRSGAWAWQTTRPHGNAYKMQLAQKAKGDGECVSECKKNCAGRCVQHRTKCCPEPGSRKDIGHCNVSHTKMGAERGAGHYSEFNTGGCAKGCSEGYTGRGFVKLVRQFSLRPGTEDHSPAGWCGGMKRNPRDLNYFKVGAPGKASKQRRKKPHNAQVHPRELYKKNEKWRSTSHRKHKGTAANDSQGIHHRSGDIAQRQGNRACYMRTPHQGHKEGKNDQREVRYTQSRNKRETKKGQRDKWNQGGPGTNLNKATRRRKREITGSLGGNKYDKNGTKQSQAEARKRENTTKHEHANGVTQKRINTGAHDYENAEARESRTPERQKYWGKGIQKHASKQTEKYRKIETQGAGHTQMRKFNNKGTHKFENVGTQGSKNIQSSSRKITSKPPQKHRNRKDPSENNKRQEHAGTKAHRRTNKQTQGHTNMQPQKRTNKETRCSKDAEIQKRRSVAAQKRTNAIKKKRGNAKIKRHKNRGEQKHTNKNCEPHNQKETKHQQGDGLGQRKARRSRIHLKKTSRHSGEGAIRNPKGSEAAGVTHDIPRRSAGIPTSSEQEDKTGRHTRLEDDI